MAAVTAFTDPLSLFEFGFEAPEQLTFNESNVIMEISFDGQNIHARMNATGPSAVIHWSSHVRRKLWVRRVGAGGSGKFVQVIAATR